MGAGAVGRIEAGNHTQPGGFGCDVDDSQVRPVVNGNHTLLPGMLFDVHEIQGSGQCSAYSFSLTFIRPSSTRMLSTPSAKVFQKP